VKKIKLLALDIDGVLTDGRTTLGVRGPVRKRLAFPDLDAINAAKRAGLVVALVTGESDASVDLVAARTGVELVRRGAKNKLAVIRNLARKQRLSLSEICFVGDGNRDAPALAKVGLAFAPSNATFAAKHAAHRVLEQRGGHGVVSESVRLLLRMNDEQTQIRRLEKELRQQLAKNWQGNRSSLPQMAHSLAQTAQALVRVVESGRKIMFCGNLAGQALSDLFSIGNNWPAVALSADAVILAKQVRALTKPQDVLLAVNSSKRSRIATKVLQEAEARGAVAMEIFYLPRDATTGFSRERWLAVCQSASRALAATD